MNELAIVFFALTLLSVALGGWQWWAAAKKSRRGVDARATVVERIMLRNGDGGTVLVVEYPIGERTVRAKVSAQHAPFDAAPGDELEIGYDPNEPGQIVLRSVNRPTALFAVSGIFFLFGVFFSFLK